MENQTSNINSFDVLDILKNPDKNFYLYQDFSHIRPYLDNWEIIKAYHRIFKTDDSREDRSDLHLLDLSNFSGTICEIGCNIGNTSLKILNSNENIKLISYDISSTATKLCNYIKDKLELHNWDIRNKDIISLSENVDCVIWEDPHTTNFEEYLKILNILFSNY